MKKYFKPSIGRFMLSAAVIIGAMLLLMLVVPNSLAYSTGETINPNTAQSRLPKYDIDGVQATTTVFFDWGTIGWVNPPNNNSYPWIQTFTDVGGSGVDVTVTVPRQHRSGNTEYVQDLVLTNGIDEDINDYTGDNEVFRFWHPDDTQIDQIIVSFSRPVQVDDLVFGGNRFSGGTYGTLEFKAFSGPSGTGSVILPNDLVYPNPSIVATVPRGTALTDPAAAPFNITDSAPIGTADLNGAYVASRESYVLVGLSSARNWGIVAYEDAMIQSFSWELYGSSVTNPLTARDNLKAGSSNSAYLGAFSFTVTDFDYGDLPDGYNTTFPNNGAAHAIGDLYLGGCVDAEFNGLPDAPATGDDLDPDSGGYLVGSCTNNNDEDGIVRNFTVPWRPGNTVTIDATVAGGTGRLAGWFDWNNDGFFDVSEFVDFGNITAGTSTLDLPISGDYTAGADLSARFRLFDLNNLPGTVDGADFERRAVNGEVEDYVWEFTPTAVNLQSFSTNNSSSLPILSIAVMVVLALIGIGVYIVRREQKQA